MSNNQVTHIESMEFEKLCENIKAISSKQKSWSVNDWPDRQLALIAEAGVYRWFLSRSQGGLGWTEDEVARGYIALGSSCLTTTFIVTQQVAALKRVAGGENESLAQSVVESMLDGSMPGTVGISHLTTSRRHLKTPMLSLREDGKNFIASGVAPWVTGANRAQHLLLGATLENGEEILFLAPSSAPEITVEAGFDLVALSASHTGMVKCDGLKVTPEMVVAGPKQSVLNSGKSGGAGGVQTSALAMGLAKAAIDFIAIEAGKRPDLTPTSDSLRQRFDQVSDELFKVATGAEENTGSLRADANSLVMRSTQAAMIAAKGAGFVKGHPVGRWCGEALFFLVWSCPQHVAEANLCELAEV